jgi:hypothetical protein
VNLLTPDRHSKDSCALLSAYTEVLALYMDQIDVRALSIQDEGDESKTTDEPVMLLEESLATPFLTLINYYLQIPFPVSNIHGIDKLYKSLITCWARYIALVTDKREEVSSGNVGRAWNIPLTLLTLLQHLIFDGFVLDGLNGVFSNRYRNHVQARYWPYFLVKLLEHKKSVDLEVSASVAFSRRFTYNGVEPFSPRLRLWERVAPDSYQA